MLSARSRFTAAALLVLALALVMRWPRISEGMPYFYNEDEAHHFNREAEMVKTGDLNPRYFHKPSLHFYARLPATAAGFLWEARRENIRSVKEIVTRDPYGLAGYSFSASHPLIVKANRAESVLFNLLSIVLAGMLAAELFSSGAAAIAAMLIAALSPDFIEQSAIIGVDGLMTLLCLAAAIAGVRAFRCCTNARLFVCAALAGLAISTKYNALPIAAVPLVAALLGRRCDPRALLIALVVPVLAFLAGSPYLLFSLPLFLDQLAYEIWHYGVAGHEGHTAEAGLPQTLFYLKWLGRSAVGVAALLAAAAGGVMALRASRRKAIVAFAFPVLFFILMAAQRANFERNMQVLIPFLAVAASGIVAFISAQLRGRSTRVAILAIASVGLVAQPALRSLIALQQSVHESRLDAAEWLAGRPLRSGDTAVAGKLQFARALYRMPGTARVDLHAPSAAELYQDGYDRVVIPAAPDLIEALAPLYIEDGDFPGFDGPQRIVQNPHIKALRAKAPAEALKTLREAKQLAEVSCALVPGTNQAKAACGGGGPEGSEDYIWLPGRGLRIVVTGAAQARAMLRLEVMTPWPAQSVGLPGGATAEVGAGRWSKIEVPLGADGAAEISVSARLSPELHEMNPDERRLGLAVRSIELVNERVPQ